LAPVLWISTDFNYWYGGRVSVNGEEHMLTRQANSRLGVTAALPVSRHQSLKISYSDGVVVRVGGKCKSFGLQRITTDEKPAAELPPFVSMKFLTSPCRVRPTCLESWAEFEVSNISVSQGLTRLVVSPIEQQSPRLYWKSP